MSDDEKTLKERLESIISKIEEYSKEKHGYYKEHEGDAIGFNQAGLMGGANFVRTLIKDEFKELWSVEEPIEAATDITGEVIYHDENDKWYFWNNIWSDTCGPFKTEFEAKYELFRYGRQLDGINIPEFSVIKPFFDKIVEDGVEDGEDE